MRLLHLGLVCGLVGIVCLPRVNADGVAHSGVYKEHAPTPPASTAETDYIESQTKAYERARDLRSVHTAFVHAQNAYDRLQHLKGADPMLEARVTLNFGAAATAVREPMGRRILLEGVALLEAQIGQEHPYLMMPLLLAGEDAVWRGRHETAYPLLKRVLDLEKIADAAGQGDALLRARATMAVARQFDSVGDEVRAIKRVEAALALTEGMATDSFVLARKIHYWAGRLMLKAGRLDEARHWLSLSLKALERLPNIHERYIRQALVRLVRLEARAREEERVVALCHKYARSDFKVGWRVLADTTGRATSEGRRRGVIHARFNVGLDCRLKEIQVVATEGLSIEEAQETLRSIVYAPHFRDGVLSPRVDQRASINVGVGG